MNSRDQMPYVEHEDTTRDGVALYALHNLTAKDLTILGELLRQRATNNIVLVNEAVSTPHIRTELALQTERVDQLSRCLTYISAQG
jgi:ribosome-interacting GTPase 1